MSEKKSTIPIYFQLKEFRPDKRQYKQQSTLLVPIDTLCIQIDVPLTHEYIANSEPLIVAQISADNPISPILTPAGYVWIMEQFEALLHDPDDVQPETFKPTVEKDDDWGKSSDDGFDNPSASTGDNEDWGDAPKAKDDDTPFEEDW